MTKYTFDTYELTEDSMEALHRQIAHVDTLMRQEKDNPRLDTEYKEVLSTLCLSLIKIEDVLDTIIHEVDYIKTPWYKKLFLWK